MEVRLIWANLMSADIARTRRFYAALGFRPNQGDIREDMTSFVFGRSNFIVNFFTQERLSEAANGNLKSAANGGESLFSLSADSKEEVDQWVGKVSAAGGTIFSEPQDYEKGYTFGFADPDGHKFNVLYWPGM